MPRRRKTAPRHESPFALPLSGPNATDPARLTVEQRLREIGAIMARAILRKHYSSPRA